MHVDYRKAILIYIAHQGILHPNFKNECDMRLFKEEEKYVQILECQKYRKTAWIHFF